jgi:hypothetical protein
MHYYFTLTWYFIREIKMVAADVLDLVSQYLDQDLCDSEVEGCGNCLRLKDYLKVVLMELKTAQQIIKILHDEKVTTNNLKNQVNLPNSNRKVPEDKLKLKERINKASHTSEKIGKVKHKIRVIGDSHAKGFANELKYKLTRDFEIQGVINQGQH